jgi:hypothetical protein
MYGLGLLRIDKVERTSMKEEKLACIRSIVGISDIKGLIMNWAPIPIKLLNELKVLATDCSFCGNH